MVTVSANFVRKLASSIAESPPPTTAMSLAPEEEAVAGGAGGHAVAEQLGLARQAEHQRAGAGRHDDRLGPVGRARRRSAVADPDAERAGTRGRPCCALTVSISAPKRSGLGPHAHHQLGAHDPVGEAGVVLDVGRQHELAAGLVAGRRRLALEHERAQVGPGGVDGGGEPGGAGTDDDDVADVGHGSGSASFRSAGHNPAGAPKLPDPGVRPRPGARRFDHRSARQGEHQADEAVGGPGLRESRMHLEAARRGPARRRWRASTAIMPPRRAARRP